MSWRFSGRRGQSPNREDNEATPVCRWSQLVAEASLRQPPSAIESPQRLMSQEVV